MGLPQAECPPGQKQVKNHGRLRGPVLVRLERPLGSQLVHVERIPHFSLALPTDLIKEISNKLVNDEERRITKLSTSHHGQFDAYQMQVNLAKEFIH